MASSAGPRSSGKPGGSAEASAAPFFDDDDDEDDDEDEEDCEPPPSPLGKALEALALVGLRLTAALAKSA
jgi:hypothetical protein